MQVIPVIPPPPEISPTIQHDAEAAAGDRSTDGQSNQGRNQSERNAGRGKEGHGHEEAQAMRWWDNVREKWFRSDSDLADLMKDSNVRHPKPTVKLESKSKSVSSLNAAAAAAS